jgi:ATP-dependent DNA helicase RecG
MEIKNIHGVGPKTLESLNNIGIYTTYDAITYYPYRYNYIHFSSLKDLTNESGYLECFIITQPKVAYIKKTFNKLSFIADFNHQQINVIIFNRGFLKNLIKPNQRTILYGKYDELKNTFVASDIKFDLQNNTIDPIYHLSNNITQKFIHKIILESLKTENNPDDYIPDNLNEAYHFITKKQALKQIHFPNSIEEIKQAKLKLIYEEFFIFMFKLSYLKFNEKKLNGIKRNVTESKILKFYELLPYKFTEDQQKTVNEIKEDMLNGTRMNRLVLGDVGSGKTSVAAYAMYINFLSKHQTSFMAPTEILAIQHYKTLQTLFKNLGMVIEILTGHMSKKEKTNIYERVKSGEINVLIGTHALINNELTFNNLGLVITDEQHRFGVLQRTTLENKGENPDVLYLSATPIPRTYALTLYGDTDISIIRTKPKGRKEIITKVYSESNLKAVLTSILNEIKSGHQAFVVSPLIENEESDLNSVVKLKEKFNDAFNNQARIEIIHGQMKQEVKDSIMNDFINNKIQILISTTVIEVGIDVPNATIMTIFNAERFGLATLHQLRGRVGRGSTQAYCFLISNKDNARLKVMEESNDGFYITEKDFEQRREGDLFGTRQSGDMSFKLGDVKKDYRILLQAKKDCEDFIKGKYYLENPLYTNIIANLQKHN